MKFCEIFKLNHSQLIRTARDSTNRLLDEMRSDIKTLLSRCE